MKALFKTLLHLLYPPLCLHCEDTVDSLFCDKCLEDLTLIDPKTRCRFCFSEWEGWKGDPCLKCRQHPSFLKRMGATCEAFGPPASLLKKMKEGRPYLAKGAGALMATQFLQLEWPFPDLIVPIPITPTEWFERGYNQNQCLAEAMAVILQRPVVVPLKRHIQKIKDCEGSEFDFKKRLKIDVKGKNLLLIDDLLTNGLNLQLCAELFWEQNPKAIFGLAFGQSIC